MTRSTLLSASPSQQQAGIAILRIVAGVVFMMHGGQKIFVTGLGKVTAGFAGMGVPMATVLAPLAGFLELVGGAALVVGVLTRLAALGLACDMLGAILLVHLSAGFFAPMGFEFPLVLFTAALTLAVAGPGAFSVDRALIARREPS